MNVTCIACALGRDVDRTDTGAYSPGVATVTLKNLTKRMLVFNLPREHVPEAATRARVARSANDADPRALTVRTETVSGSVTLAAAGTRGSEAEVPASALRAPEVQKALRASQPLVAVVEKKNAAAEAPPAPEVKKRARKEGSRGE
jgi:hypothetical protein